MTEIKIHNYGGWISLCFILLFFLPGVLFPVLGEYVFIVSYMILIVIAVLIVLSIRQHRQIKKNKQEKNKTLLIHGIPICVIIYPMICFLTLFLAGFSVRFFENDFLPLLIIISGFVLGLIPGPVLFIQDQRKLKQYKKENKECRESCLCRSVTFWACYIFIALFILATATAIYDFIHRAD